MDHHGQALTYDITCLHVYERFVLLTLSLFLFPLRRSARYIYVTGEIGIRANLEFDWKNSRPGRTNSNLDRNICSWIYMYGENSLQ